MSTGKRLAKRSILGTRVACCLEDGKYYAGVICAVKTMDDGGPTAYSVRVEGERRSREVRESDLVGSGFTAVGSVKLRVGQRAYITHNNREVCGTVLYHRPNIDEVLISVTNPEQPSLPCLAMGHTGHRAKHLTPSTSGARRYPGTCHPILGESLHQRFRGRETSVALVWYGNPASFLVWVCEVLEAASLASASMKDVPLRIYYVLLIYGLERATTRPPSETGVRQDVKKRIEDIRLLESRKSARLADQDTDFAKLADMSTDRKERKPSQTIDVPAPTSGFQGSRKRRSSRTEEDQMDECAAAMVLMKLSCSPRSPVLPDGKYPPLCCGAFLIQMEGHGARRKGGK
ncbi:hypothetical protein GWK47_054327 [Chionoecetes opilio]|uniref:DUF4772 domain-containing protein n=1 Tax=Chionoecetes opilio TaxID=41210 RepID=A0A8J5C7F9_CHIOP|nr:hypothetical protein GWK47_054327 [Chionoecetes opilio]